MTKIEDGRDFEPDMTYVFDKLFYYEDGSCALPVEKYLLTVTKTMTNGLVSYDYDYKYGDLRLLNFSVDGKPQRKLTGNFSEMVETYGNLLYP